MMERHRKAVDQIAAAVKTYFDRGEPYRIFHGSTNSTRPRPGPNNRVVDISSLSNVLSVNRNARTALVEPNVPMDRLVEVTMKHGLIPPVVMEFPGITVGGGFAGTSGESSSFRHGFFNETVDEVEMVLGSGDVVTASRNERADLFRGAAGAVGSLGVTTLLGLRLIEARNFVRTTYHRTNSFAEAAARIRAEIENPKNDYVDGIVFSKDHAVVITGSLADDRPADCQPQTFSHASDPWFYLHVQEKTKDAPPSLSSNTGITDFIPLAEYLFRYDRGGFWVGTQAFAYFKYIPFNRLSRWFLDDMMNTRMLYRALHASNGSESFLVQDLALPYDTAEEFVSYTTDEFNIWPLWLCPLKETVMPTFHPVTGDEKKQEANGGGPTLSKPMLNIGLWGWGPKTHDEFVAKNRALEDKLIQLGGRKWLYAHTYYSEDEFWDVYERPWYDALREKYHATTLPDAWSKVRIDLDSEARRRGEWKRSIKGMWPLGGLYAIHQSIRSKDYLLHRHAEWKHEAEKASSADWGKDRG